MPSRVCLCGASVTQLSFRGQGAGSPPQSRCNFRNPFLILPVPHGSNSALHSPASALTRSPSAGKERCQRARKANASPLGWRRLGSLFWPREEPSGHWHCPGLLWGGDNRHRKGVAAEPCREPGSPVNNSCPQPGQEVIHLPGCIGPAGHAGRAPRDQAAWTRRRHSSSPCAGRGSISGLLVTGLPSLGVSKSWAGGRWGELNRPKGAAASALVGELAEFWDQDS